MWKRYADILRLSGVQCMVMVSSPCQAPAAIPEDDA